jgi:hypothetical protein
MNMIIDEYSFGLIKVAGKEYTSDVIIYPDRVNSSWWREDGHRLVPKDLADVLLDPPTILVIGTGYAGRMAVPAETFEDLRGRGMQVFAARTEEAVEDFNRLQRQHARVVAALHLTC